MIKEISTATAPAAIGPYSQALCIGQMVYTSGQIPIDPATGTMPEAIAQQAKQALENLKHVLEAAGTGLDRVVKTTLFIKNMDDFARINEVYSGYFSQPYPARACVEVARLPKDALIEVEAVAEIS